MDRRSWLEAAAALAGAAAFDVDAQATKPRRIGFVSNGGSGTGAAQMGAFRAGLRESGWIEGQTVVIEQRWADGQSDRLPGLLVELVQARVDVIVVSGPAAMAAAQKATTTLPVVFVLLVDPVSMGFVKSLAHPGGNMTGLSSQYEQLITKQLQLLKETVPNLSRVALLRHAEAAQSILAAAEAAARSLGLTARTLTVGGVTEFEDAFKAARGDRAGAVHVLPSPFFGAQRARIIELAARHRLPAFYELKLYVQDGGLMSYGPSLEDLYGRSASYVDRILKGANPGDLAIERPARFELVVNRKTAQALGLSIPASVLSQADEIIG